MQFRTRNTLYTLVDRGDGAFEISGHSDYCPSPTLCTLYGPITLGKSVIFVREADGHRIWTTDVQEILP